MVNVIIYLKYLRLVQILNLLKSSCKLTCKTISPSFYNQNEIDALWTSRFQDATQPEYE